MKDAKLIHRTKHLRVYVLPNGELRFVHRHAIARLFAYPNRVEFTSEGASMVLNPSILGQSRVTLGWQLTEKK